MGVLHHNKVKYYTGAMVEWDFHVDPTITICQKQILAISMCLILIFIRYSRLRWKKVKTRRKWGTKGNEEGKKIQKEGRMGHPE